MPYLRDAAKRFAGRNLELVGLNTDVELPTEQVKKTLEDNGMNWTQAKLESVFDFLNVRLRIESFPTTFLISEMVKLLLKYGAKTGIRDNSGDTAPSGSEYVNGTEGLEPQEKARYLEVRRLLKSKK